jgi:hypothetical protein
MIQNVHNDFKKLIRSVSTFECLDWQPSQFSNIVGKDGFIWQYSNLAGERLRD